VIGLTVSHYQIISKIGGGGMGIIYQARDLKLGRLVALKFLPAPMAGDREAFHRLAREARAASALNHPNICTIYEIDEHDGQPFIAMELLHGETLRHRIARGPVPVQEAIALVRQILDALEAVHSNGIVHRDLKPENIFLTRTGHVKLLDFGIAKIVRTGPFPFDESNPPAATVAAQTSDVSIVGTLAYMSPEQIRGEDLGLETDLFALGTVFFEMLTGKQAFSGKTSGMLLDAVLTRSPGPVRNFDAKIPARLEQIVGKLLEKDRTRRYASAARVKADLLVEKDTISDRIRSSRFLRLAAVAAALLVIAAASFYFLRPDKGSTSSSIPQMLMKQLTSQPGMELFPTLSPDGKTVAYASQGSGNWDVYVLRVGGQNALNLTADSAADDTQPAFSPSGELITFRSERDGGGIYVMGATGESVRRVTDSGFNPAWSPDGRQIVVADENVVDDPNARRGSSQLSIVDLMTSARRRIAVEDGVQPNWSPHGFRIAYWGSRGGQRDIWTIRPDGTDARRITDDAAVDWNPVWDPSGQFLYFSSDRGGSINLWRVPVDEKSGETRGLPQAITSGAGQRQHPSFSSDGKFIAYVEEAVTENIKRAGFDSARARFDGSPQAVTRGNRSARNPDVSPDGQWLAFQSWGTQEDIYVVRSDGTGERYLTNDIYKDRVPRWSPDGHRIAFYSNRSGNYEIWTINSDGSGLTQITDDRTSANSRSVWSPDGRRMAGFHSRRGTFLIDLEKPRQPDGRRFLPPINQAGEIFEVWSWSPDGEWLAGHRVNEPGGELKGIAIYSLRNGRYEILSDHGYTPVWTRDGRKLIFTGTDRAYLFDIATKNTKELGAVNDISQLSSDGGFIYFTVVEREADLWLIDLH
jgi:eukaryotic-like serine/threonine-protein kinase